MNLKQLWESFLALAGFKFINKEDFMLYRLDLKTSTVQILINIIIYIYNLQNMELDFTIILF